MRLHRRLTAAAAAALVTSLGLPALAFAADGTPNIQITEFEYNTSEFVELTNVGTAPQDFTGWSFSDSGATPGDLSLSGFGTVAPGESVIISEDSADAFRAARGLKDTVKVVGGNTTNLGNGDAINIYDAGNTLVDSLTYPGDKATQTKSGYVHADALAETTFSLTGWTLSSVGDAEGSWTGLNGGIGTPGASTLGTSTPDDVRLPADGGDPGDGTPTDPAPTLDCQPEAASGTGPAAAGAVTWPGSSAVTVVDKECAWKTTTGPEGRDMSGMVFDKADPNVLWAVKNKSWIFRLVKDTNGLWVPDTANGWGAGKEIYFPGTTGEPDSEGITQGPDGMLYTTTERDNAANTIAHNAILAFDPSANGTSLTAVKEWNLTDEFPELKTGTKTDANLGFEGVTYVPDSYLVDNGFVDQSTGAAYDPARYPLHGKGLFFAALENDGKLYAYTLNSDGSFHRVAVVDTTMGHVMDVQYDAALQRVWALCDNTCSVSMTVLGIDATGTMTPQAVYAKPADLPVVNLEGFAIAPASTCVNGARTALWSDDGISAPGHLGHALYAGALPCTLDLPAQGTGSGNGNDQGQDGPGQDGGQNNDQGQAGGQDQGNGVDGGHGAPANGAGNLARTGGPVALAGLGALALLATGTMLVRRFR